MRRGTLAILKYVPAVLCGLLLVAWVVNFFAWFGIIVHLYDRELHVAANRGTLFLYVRVDPQPPSLRFASAWHSRDVMNRQFSGLRFVISDESDLSMGDMYVVFPIPLAVTLLSLGAIGPLTRFRFPLWSYFVWTALIAAELAYYLR